MMTTSRIMKEGKTTQNDDRVALRPNLAFLEQFFARGRESTLVGEVDAPDISAWFAYLRRTLAGAGAA